MLTQDTALPAAEAADVLEQRDEHTHLRRHTFMGQWQGQIFITCGPGSSGSMKSKEACSSCNDVLVLTSLAGSLGAA